MYETTILNTNGKSTGKVKLAKEIFFVQPNSKLLSQAVRVHLLNQRKARAKVKTRSQVSGSGRKIWRQKGTGRARHGDRYAPIFVGGGVAHGPKGRKNSKLKLSKQMAKQAFASILSQKLKDQELVIVDGLNKLEPKTKIFAEKLRNISKTTNQDLKKISIVVSHNSENIRRGARNLKDVFLLPTTNVNTYQLVNSGLLIIMKDALEALEQQLFAHQEKNTKT